MQDALKSPHFRAFFGRKRRVRRAGSIAALLAALAAVWSGPRVLLAYEPPVSVQGPGAPSYPGLPGPGYGQGRPSRPPVSASPSYGPSSPGVGSYGRADRPQSTPAPTSRTSAYDYSEDAWRRPLPPARGVYGASDAAGQSPSRPLLPVDKSIAEADFKPATDEPNDDRYTDLQTSFFYLFGQGPDEAAAERYYQEGLEHYAAERYAQAAASFGWADFRFPECPQKEDALYMEAESHFFAGDYVAAQKDYLDLLELYDHPKRRDVIVRRLFRIAQFWDALDENINATPVRLSNSEQPWIGTFSASMRTYEKIWTHDPLGDLADDSLMAAGASYMRQRRLDDAVTSFQFLRREHADSEHLLNAYKYEILCRREMYQGPEYDGKSLNEAGRLIDQALVQFGPHLGPTRQELVEAKNEVQVAKAERDWAIAQYYDKKQLYGAARVYYESIPRDYPGTPFAEMARRRYAEIQGFPAEPSRLAWMTDWVSPDDTTRR